MPNCARYWLTCSIELDPSDPLNLENSGTDTWVAAESDQTRWGTAWNSRLSFSSARSRSGLSRWYGFAPPFELQGLNSQNSFRWRTWLAMPVYQRPSQTSLLRKYLPPKFLLQKLLP